MIEFKNVSKIFNAGKKNQVKAVDNISFTVEDSDIYGVIGFSGAGKSTLVRMVNALELPGEGQVLVDGVDVSSLKGNELRQFRRNIGMIFQHFNLLGNKTVAQNIGMPLVLQHEKSAVIKQKVSELLEFVGLSDKANAYPSQLSGGQKQRVGIARALATDPKILLCDEATSALDPRTTDAILELLKKVNKDLGVTILMITHQMNVIQQICNKVTVLEKGQIVEQGSVIEVFGNPKKETTKGFIRTVINDRLPESVKKYLREYKEPQRVVRLRFDGKNADDPVMTAAVKETGVNISILYGIVTELEGKVIGFQTVQITGTEQQIVAAEKFFDAHGIEKAEVDL
ncbi:MAG: ATP-binding cassette domain-containing protein [Treponema sp.]|nr:ATP-binding cassette domain-containing protein [Treponema sp.]